MSVRPGQRGARQGHHHLRDIVQAATHTLADYLGTRGPMPAFGWGVVFPDAEAPANLGPELPRALVIDRASLQWADMAVHSVISCFS